MSSLEMPTRCSTPRSSSSSGNANTAALNRPRLRNSCQACSSAKLGCSSEKPQCSRCAIRGLNCEYLIARRTGRGKKKAPTSTKQRGDQSTASSTSTTNDDLNHFTQAPSLHSETSRELSEAPRSPSYFHQSLGNNLTKSTPFLQDFFDPLDPTFSAISTDAETDFEDFFNPSLPFALDLPDPGDPRALEHFSSGFHSNSTSSESLFDVPPVSGDAISDLFTLSIPETASKHTIPPSCQVQSYHNITPDTPPCSCISQALELMKQLFSPCPSASVSWTPRHLAITTLLPTARIVIGRNEATIEAASAMFECSCSQDGYHLTVLSLIIFRVLNWYAAIAPKTTSVHGGESAMDRSASQPPSNSSEHSETKDSRLHCKESARMIVQLILSELHRVRRLVDLLSPKLRLQAEKERGDHEKREGQDMEWEKTLPLPADMYRQLDSDLRRRLKGLARELVGRLRRF